MHANYHCKNFCLCKINFKTRQRVKFLYSHCRCYSRADLTNPVLYLGSPERSLDRTVPPYEHFTSWILIEDARLTLTSADLNHLAVGYTMDQSINQSITICSASYVKTGSNR